MAQITVLKDHETLAAAAADRFTMLARKAIEARDRMVVGLAGGWSPLHVVWSDERPVPPEDEQSNFGMASRALIDHVPIPPGQVHRMRAELTDVEEAAHEYERIVGNLEPIDAVLLGIGQDGHIASIFPRSPLLDSSSVPVASARERVAAVWVEQLRSWRITLTPRALLDARAILVLVSGAEKAETVRAALEGPKDVRRWPAQLLRRAANRVEWLTDGAAAQRLSAPPA